ncbi:flagellar basal body rod protein FlgB [Glycocaulis albus]|jgi:flagellar basal-body rod protein FlgB|uniref:Flagellar basal body rod protein FlgB n=2 Tax=Glycocaulis albus TaxID=1382801 RepID=A0ABQ1XTJ8_9PROT|nr:flagellar basal body rod protein FlgB [Glycocaulis albus]
MAAPKREAKRMRPDDIPVLGILRQALGYHSDRQRVIAENVANANTPGYVPDDIPQSEFERALSGAQTTRRVTLNATESGHIQGRVNSGGSGAWRAMAAPDSETTINGNAVVLEEQMVRSGENRMRFETALGLYQKSLSLIRMAARGPGA